MAGITCTVNSGEVALVAATPKSVLQIKAAANQRVVLKSLSVFGKQAAAGTDTPVMVRLTLSSANFGTGSAATPGKLDPAWAEAVQTTCAGNFTVEPTTPADSGIWFEVQPQSGLINPFPFGQEPRIPGGHALTVELTSIATPTVLVSATFEE